MKSHQPARTLAFGLVGMTAVLLSARPADAGLFRRPQVVVVAPAPVVAVPVETVYAAAPVTTVTETRAVYEAPVVVRAPVATSYTTTTVYSAPVRTSYLVPAARVYSAPAVVETARPVKVVVPRRVYRYPY
jgi:hypothetical protein